MQVINIVINAQKNAV